MKKVALNSTTDIDLGKLIDSKLLIQANSGGGKSWLIRRILEQSHGKVQQIIIDPEGEFGTLREKYDYILCGKGGDAVADPRSAAMLAHKLLEHKASAIIDLYELHPQERKRFVHLFVDALVDAPKELWNDCLIVIDEAHDFVPEKGDSEAANALIGLMAKGRKRGFGAILATQRISKLHKDAAAECNNKLIGRSTLDIDRKRASEELGFTTKEESLSLRSMKPGEFFAFGPALSDEVKRIQVGDIKTAHPKVGSRSLGKVAPPSDSVKKILAKLGDIPKEAEKEAKTVADLKKENADLKRMNTNLLKHPFQKDLTQEEAYRIAKPLLDALRAEKDQELYDWQTKWQEQIQNWFKIIIGIGEAMKEAQRDVRIKKPKASIPLPMPVKSIQETTTFEVVRNANTNRFEVAPEDGKFGLCERKIYSFLMENTGRLFTKVQVGAVTGYSPTSGGFNNALARLNAAGLIQKSGNGIFLGNVTRPDLKIEGEEFSAEPKFWKQKLGACENKIYEYLWERQNHVIPKEQVGYDTGYSPTSGGFNNAISRLNSIGLIRRVSGGLQINQELLNI